VRLSVVIPTFNSRRFIAEAIHSVLGQCHLASLGVEVDVLVVDNGSTDNTVELVDTLFGGQVRLMTARDHQGAFHPRNVGMAAAEGEWVALLDADDLWAPDKLYRQLIASAQQPELELLFCGGVEFSDPKAAFPFRQDPQPFLSPSALLMRRTALERTGPFPPFRAGEFIAWFGWAKALGLRWHVLPETLVRRRVHRSNTSRDRTALADYPRAMGWLLSRRTELVAAHPAN
jgi:glycosyltransferase involved in cell wall biosynthesis